MITLTTDVEEIHKILSNPVILSTITDDACENTSSEELKILIESSFERNMYFAVRQEEKTVGIVFGHLFNSDPTTIEFHVNFLPEARGEFAKEETKKVIDYVFTHYLYNTIAAVIAGCYINVMNFVLALEMVSQGEVPVPYIKGGKQYKSFLFTLAREDHYGRN